MKPLPIVAIIGRPNVGKSTFFNRVLRQRLAVVDDKPGVTRDRLYGLADWSGREFHLVDTGGFIPDSDDLINRLVREQAEIAIDEADLVLFMVDSRVGPTDLDEDIARRLQRSDRPVVVVANKSDNEIYRLEANAFYRLGLGEPIDVAALTGYNIGDLLDIVIGKLPETEYVEEEGKLKIAVIGRPNVGKSSFVNFLCGKERLIVTDIPGTTRDSIDTEIVFQGEKYILIDTAGLRRKSKVKESLEFYTTLRTLRSLERCDVAAVIIEADEGLMHQDIQVLEQAHLFRKSMLLVVNKWDLVEKDTDTVREYELSIKKKIPTFSYLPMVFISALTGKRSVNVLKLCKQVHERQIKRIQTAEMNRFIEETVRRRHPAAVKGKHIKFFYATQTEISPPTFVFFCNYPKLLQKQYIRYIENRLRETYDFEGVPIRLKVKPRARK
ncbi:MAG: ribosome biogenesis GTPase Der [candidate division Zixibacteria bacterium]|nr:ribosome biogenesis GTPase Der [candidate division Zixibacteria bacterium]